MVKDNNQKQIRNKKYLLTVKMPFVTEEEIASRHHILQFRYIDFIKNQRTFEGIKIQQYAILEPIGQGAFAEIYRGVDELKNKQVAVKVLNLKSIETQKNFLVKNKKRRLADEESKIMMKFNSPHILKCYECFQNKDFKIMMIQFCNSGSLQDKIYEEGAIPQNQAIYIIKQIISGIGECHREKIIHRDMKPDNILIHNGEYKIADFGFSKMLDIQNQQEITINTRLGTIITMAPQVLNGEKYGLKADIWSVGVIFFHMLFGECPFKSNTAIEMVTEIANTKLLTEKEYNKIRPSENAKKFLRQVLVVNIQKRLGWKELLNHDLLKTQNSQLGDNFQRHIELRSENEQLQKLDREFVIEEMRDPIFFRQSNKYQTGLMEYEKDFDQGDTNVDEIQKPSNTKYTESEIVEAYINNKQQQKYNDHQEQNQQVSDISCELSKYLNQKQNQKQNNLKKQQLVQKQKQANVIKMDLEAVSDNTNIKKCQRQGLEDEYELDTDRGQSTKPKQNHFYNREIQKIPYKKKNQQVVDCAATGYKTLSQQERLKIQKNINRQQTQIYKWAQKIYIECKKTQVLYEQILEPIQQYQMLDLKKRSNIEFMYLISTRCLNNMSPINDTYDKRKNSPIIQELKDKVKTLYQKVSKIWEKYSMLLTSKENQKIVIIFDWFSKMLNNQKIKKKDKYLSGIENMLDYKEQKQGNTKQKEWQNKDLQDYDKSEQISFTIEYIKSIVNELRISQKTTSVIKHLNCYKGICLIDFEDLRMRTFDQYLKLYLM